MPSLIQKNIPLATKTTLGVGGCAEYFAIVKNIPELQEVVQWAKKEHMPIIPLGGGSNVLISDGGIHGLVLQLACADVTYIEDGKTIRVAAGAGLALDRLIEECVQKKLWGLENLSAIPGMVGAVPIQNVGAYGVEAKDVVHSVTVFDLTTESIHIFSNSMCCFAYRDSLFKRKDNPYIILEVVFVLTEYERPILTYKDLYTHFESENNPTLEDIRAAIIAIRGKKFPDWKHVGTAGSFFKNPSIPREKYTNLLQTLPQLPGYEQNDGTVKISLGWVLDHVCALRGYRDGNVSLYAAQALVLVCVKGATAEEIKNFSEKVIEIVYEKIGVHIEREVTLL